MLLNSLPFLGFFAAIVVVYYLTPRRWRWIPLLVASYYFYSTFDARYLMLLAAMTGVAYLAGRILEGMDEGRARRLILAGAVVLELSGLVLFKYADFLVESVEPVLFGTGLLPEALVLPRLEFLLPVGLSFYSFSCVSYIVDVHRRKMAAERHLGLLAVYVSFFPKLIAGPIERAEPFLRQLARGRAFRAANVSAGAQLLLWGLFKKVVIADRLAGMIEPAFASPAFQSPVALIIAIYLYAFQIYCDFSGYSDMAIGAARIMGFRLAINFRRPYLSTNVAEFWSKRWHVSLANWFRDYMYIPMGGSRVPLPRLYFNLMAVFLVSGLWHGASWTFVVWGGLNGAYQLLFLMLTRVRNSVARPLRRVQRAVDLVNILVTFHLIAIAWVFFRADTISTAVSMLRRVAGAIPSLPTAVSNYSFSGEIVMAAILILVLLVVEAIDEAHPIRVRLARQPTVVRWGAMYALIFSLIILGTWNMNEFVYMQF